MVSFTQLLLPLFASAVAVFFASSLIHMVFKWHQPDYRPLSNEDEVMAAIRKGISGGGQYSFPYCADMKQMQTPEFQAKLEQGPTGFVLARGPGKPGMGKPLLQWFLLALFTAGIAGCICGSTLTLLSSSKQVFHIAGLVTFAAYSVGSVTAAIWYARPWGAVGKDLLDAVVYSLITGAVYAALWPEPASILTR